MAPVLAPGATIGIVGGGQLGRMLSFEAHRHGYRTAVLTGGAKDTPGGRIAEVEVAAGYDDDLALQRFVDLCDVITWEFENVEVGLLEELATRSGAYPCDLPGGSSRPPRTAAASGAP